MNFAWCGLACLITFCFSYLAGNMSGASDTFGVVLRTIFLMIVTMGIGVLFGLGVR
jgi:hypothetical protein